MTPFKLKPVAVVAVLVGAIAVGADALFGS
jgi:hypothetical protein